MVMTALAVQFVMTKNELCSRYDCYKGLLYSVSVKGCKISGEVLTTEGVVCMNKAVAH